MEDKMKNLSSLENELPDCPFNFGHLENNEWVKKKCHCNCECEFATFGICNDDIAIEIEDREKGTKIANHTSEEIKYRLSNIGEAIGNIALEYIIKLEEQIEKMKNCFNCTHYHWSNGDDYCDDHYGQPVYDEDCKDKWKLK